MFWSTALGHCGFQDICWWHGALSPTAAGGDGRSDVAEPLVDSVGITERVLEELQHLLFLLRPMVLLQGRKIPDRGAD